QLAGSAAAGPARERDREPGCLERLEQRLVGADGERPRRPSRPLADDLERLLASRPRRAEALVVDGAAGPSEAQRRLDDRVQEAGGRARVGGGPGRLPAEEGLDVEPLAARVVVLVDGRIALHLEQLDERRARRVLVRVVELVRRPARAELEPLREERR